MSRPLDLDAAVRDGVITADQARVLAGGAIAEAPRGEEPFRLANGFNEVFTALGITALGAGLVVLGWSWGGLFKGGRADASLAWLLPSAGLLWLLAELVARRLRLLLPSIVLCTFFVGFFAFGAEALVPESFMRSTMNPAVPRSLLVASATRPLVFFAFAALGAWLFERRFRLPYAYLLLAGAFAGVVVVLAGYTGTRALLTPALLLAGLIAFAAAMRFDLSDPARTSRASDNAFWLHLAAAPLITHSLLNLLGSARTFMETGGIAAILVLFVLASLVALVIDRRAPLVAMLSYLGAAVAALLGRAGLSGGGLVALALLLVGALVVVLGVGWQPLRARALRLVPGDWAARLRPLTRGAALARVAA